MPSKIVFSQRDRVLAHLKATGMARLRELMEDGVTAATVSRLEHEGLILRLARGLYRLADAPLDVHHHLAQVSKLVPKGVICLTSALAYHGLTDQMPAKVWLALGLKEWRPRFSYPPVRFVRFSETRLQSGVEHVLIDGVNVPLFGVARTVADLFRYRQTIGIHVAIEGLREALKYKKTTPSQIAQQAVEAKVWKIMQPYMQALTSDA
jgi:predicted transcriptional regulator of viral defense system